MEQALPSSERFRVVIVGGGPVGLTAAHALLRAGIDFVMLETRGTCMPEEGASLLAWPSTHRVWHQLGLFDAMQAQSAPIETRTTVTHGGQLYRTGSPGLVIRKLFGTPPLNFHRRNLVRVLHDKLPADVRAACILTGKKVCELAPDASGVTVRCEDGTVVRGTMVLGVDGVHSKTRGMMRALALESDINADCINPERPFRAEYRCLWGTCPRPEACPPNSNAETHGSERSLMFMTARDQAWFFLYEQLDTPTDARQDYTGSDQEQIAARFADMHVLPNLKFDEVWPTRTACGMANQLEGVLPHWHLAPAAGGRVVLAGDAVHRFTPNFGWGYNSGVNDVAVLVSLLHTEVVQREDSSLPSTEALDSIFARYQKARKVDDDIGNVAAASGRVTRQCARPRQWLAAAIFWALEHVLPLLIPNFEMWAGKNILGKIMRRGRVLDYLPEDAAASTDARVFGGLVKWDFPIPTIPAAAADTEKKAETDSEQSKQQDPVR
jgi:2-polyprenyl-6-methoxyphenol hydroxylase-like FAD-dependent oxidoreductase